MKIKYIAGLLLMGASVMTSCSDFTEIDAKGNNLLASTSDLELLLNPEYEVDCRPVMEVSGDLIYSYQRFSQTMMVSIKTANSIRMSWDQEGWVEELPRLTQSDSYYASCYGYIGRIANPILKQIDGASGNESSKAAIKAEAYLIRAYFHYLAIQKFAPAYTPSTAESTVGLVYLKEDQDIKTPAVPVDLQTFYDNILADLKAAEELDALPEKAVNQMRFNKGALYAVKALVLMAMQRYDEAATAANSALAVNSTLVRIYDNLGQTYAKKDDTSPDELVPVIVRPRLDYPEDYFGLYGYAAYNNITPYAISHIEAGHVLHDYMNITGLHRDQEQRDKLSTDRLGEPGYWTTNGSLSEWYPPCGLSTPQMYLILAETAIHKGNYDEAMGHIDKIRENRIVPEVYAPLKGSVSDKATAIKRFKMTAKTEGLQTIWNFVNLKRWNQLGADWEETINRTICDKDMTLTPQSKLWVFPIPQNVINSNPNFKPFMN